MSDSIDAQAVALDDGLRRWTHGELDAQARLFAERLREQGTRVFATLMDNSPAWVVADMAAARAGLVHVPLPVFFSSDQVVHALRSAGVDTLLVKPPLAAQWASAPASDCTLAHERLCLLRLPADVVAIPPGTRKITFTSGSTGAPKGVCLDGAAMDSVAESLVQAMKPLAVRRHLCALPFAVLLENIAGVTAPLRAGATCIVLPLRRLGLTGSSSFDAAAFHAAVEAQQPDSIILLPQMLRAWAGWLMLSGRRAPSSLKMVAVGGAAVGIGLLRAARALGIPAFEGYGLSEGASVQTLNLPGADRPGSAGRALPHARLRIAPDGEVEVAGSLFRGYLGAKDGGAARDGSNIDAGPRPTPLWWPTGDLGTIDADGFLHISGRKKNLLITAFGRNVSPEWVETGLRGEPSVAQAVVYGDAQPALSAVLWPLRADAPDALLQQAVDAANAALPDYARVQRWVRGLAEFTPGSGLATANGRPRREAILQLHADALGIAVPDNERPGDPR